MLLLYPAEWGVLEGGGGRRGFAVARAQGWSGDAAWAVCDTFEGWYGASL